MKLYYIMLQLQHGNVIVMLHYIILLCKELLHAIIISLH